MDSNLSFIHKVYLSEFRSKSNFQLRRTLDASFRAASIRKRENRRGLGAKGRRNIIECKRDRAPSDSGILRAKRQRLVRCQSFIRCMYPVTATR
jgi:hypothetical protein